MLFGGSTVSWSVTSEANTVTVQLSRNAKSTAGSSVNVVGPPLRAAACEPLAPQTIEYQALETSTGSLKVIPMFVLKPTPTAPESGEVAVIAGALSPVQKWKGDAVLRGFAALMAKSDALLSVSTQPSPVRIAAVVLLRFAIGVPSKQLVADP